MDFDERMTIQWWNPIACDCACTQSHVENMGVRGRERSTQLQGPLSKSWATLAQPKATHSNCILLITCSRGIATGFWRLLFVPNGLLHRLLYSFG